ncbi:MAG: tetratricopeptide repeat protein [Mariprofundus sp.]
MKTPAQPLHWLLIASLMLLSACASINPQETARQQKLANLHYQIGVDALGKGLLPKAFKELMESNTMQPDQPAVLDALAYAWLLRGDLKQSETFYRRALHHGGGAATQNNYANLLNKLERYPEAETAARTSLDDPRYPNQDLAFINLGNALLGQNKAEAAIKAFQQALVFNPDNRLAKRRLADGYARNGKARQAELLYESILSVQADNRGAAQGLVAALVQMQRPDAALAVLNRFSQQTTSAIDRAWAADLMEQVR